MEEDVAAAKYSLSFISRITAVSTIGDTSVILLMKESEHAQYLAAWQLRENIAQRMWQKYLVLLQNRNQNVAAAVVPAAADDLDDISDAKIRPGVNFIICSVISYFVFEPVGCVVDSRLSQPSMFYVSNLRIVHQ